MKKIVIALAALTVIACKKEAKTADATPEAPKDYVTFSGTLKNAGDIKELNIVKGQAFKKVISVNEDGTFSDTLKIKDGKFYLLSGDQYARLVLKNGDDLKVSMDQSEFDKSLSFEGTGAEACNYLAASTLLESNFLGDESLELDSVAYSAHMNKLVVEQKALQAKYTSLDSTFLNEEVENLKKSIKGMVEYHSAKLALKKEFPAGTPSPKFSYESIDGKTVALDDLKGKYVYIDIWATWCGPCKREIPHLKEVEKEFHGKNIEFVSISVDRADDKQKWMDMVKEKEMVGIQLFADKDWSSDFVQAYKVMGIPRFILLDPNGNVVDPDAPTPSSPKLKTLLNGLSNI